MFSANENLMLRQHKRRIVDKIESTMPEEALDYGTTVMVMQVSCKAPGCVPLETAIIIVFPKHATELVPGLPESKNGGSYKTKILKPMANVDDDDILEALPPAFKGGKRTMEKLCMYARDVMLAQITQLFGEDPADAVEDRHAMAEYLQTCLQDYMDRNCQPPELGEPFPPLQQPSNESPPILKNNNGGINDQESPPLPKVEDTSQVIDLPKTEGETKNNTTTTPMNFPKTGNIVIRRSESSVADIPAPKNPTSAPTSTPTKTPNQLFERQHAPGIRQAGCPCCDPDNPSVIADMMLL